MAAFHFRCVAIRETYHWDQDFLENSIVAGADVFGVYLYREGERTYCCELTPSAWCEFVQNDFVRPDGLSLLTPAQWDDDAVGEALSELEKENSGERGGYYSYHLINNPDRPLIRSKRLTINVNTREYKERGNTRDDAYRAAAEAAWEEAREYLQGNGRLPIPVLDRPNCWRDLQRAESAKVIPTLPLFAYVGQL